MDLLQLEHFLAVAEEGSFTRAAERVFRTQPAVSQSVKKLEEGIGVPLFARDMPELTLTEAGHAIVEYAKRMLKLRDDAMRQVGELHNLTTGHLRIAAYESAAVYLLPGPLRGYFRQFPQIKVGIYRGRLDEIPRQVDRMIAMIDHALKAVNGNIADTQGMIAALEKADFPSVRGTFKYNKNHFPIENFYLLKIVKDADASYVRKIQNTVFADHADAYAGECKMK